MVWLSKVDHGDKPFDFIWYKIRHNAEEDINKRSNLPVRISIKIKMLEPRTTSHTYLDGNGICSIKMPNFSFKW